MSTKGNAAAMAKKASKHEEQRKNEFDLPIRAAVKKRQQMALPIAMAKIKQLTTTKREKGNKTMWRN